MADPTATPSKGSKYSGGPQGTPTKTATPSPVPTSTPPAGLTSFTSHTIGLASGQIAYEDLVAKYGKAYADQVDVAISSLSAADKREVAAIKAKLATQATPTPSATPAPAAPTPPPAPAGAPSLSGLSPEWQRQQAGEYRDANSREIPIPADNPLSSAVNAARATSSGGSSGYSGGYGDGKAEVVEAPKAPIPNSAEDLTNKGAIQVGNRFVLGGQQYMRQGEVKKAVDGKYYVVQPDGSISQPFATETEANRNNVFSQMGPAVTSKSGNSPLAQYAQTGSGPTLSNSIFDTVSRDQQIAAGATKGSQVGDVISTTNFRGRPLDITNGAISEGGGLKPVTDGGNSISYTGQLNDNTSIGMSSALGRPDTAYWLQQAAGVPGEGRAIHSAFTNLAKDPVATQRAFDKIAAIRAAGNMPNWDSLALYNEPGISGLNLLGSSSNTDFDKKLAWLMEQLEQQDLEYMPDPYQQPANPEIFAEGGTMSAQEINPRHLFIGRGGEVTPALNLDDNSVPGLQEQSVQHIFHQSPNRNNIVFRFDRNTPEYDETYYKWQQAHPLWTEDEILNAMDQEAMHLWQTEGRVPFASSVTGMGVPRGQHSQGLFSRPELDPREPLPADMQAAIANQRSSGGSSGGGLMGAKAPGTIPRIYPGGGKFKTSGLTGMFDLSTMKPLAFLGGGPQDETVEITPNGTEGQQQQAAVEEKGVADAFSKWWDSLTKPAPVVPELQPGMARMSPASIAKDARYWQARQANYGRAGLDLPIVTTPLSEEYWATYQQPADQALPPGMRLPNGQRPAPPVDPNAPIPAAKKPWWEEMFGGGSGGWKPMLGGGFGAVA